MRREKEREEERKEREERENESDDERKAREKREEQRGAVKTLIQRKIGGYILHKIYAAQDLLARWIYTPVPAVSSSA